jgi:hypothetical protein
MSHGSAQRRLIITDHTANPIAQRLDRLEEASLKGDVVG